MKNQKITVLSISDSTGTNPPLAGANGELGPLALKSDVANITSGLSVLINGSNDATSSLITISHQSVNTNITYPLVSLSAPTSATALLVQGVTNRTSTSFDVILSSTPTSGYKINWQMITPGTGYVAKAYGVQEISGSLNANYYPDASSVETKRVILDSNITVEPAVNMTDGQYLTLLFIQNISGNGIVSYDSSYKFPNGIKTVTPSANAVDLLKVLKVGSNYYCTLNQNLY